MRWFKIMTLTLLVSGLSITVGFAELQAFINADKITVRESLDYSSNPVTELKYGDRVEVLETTTPLLINPYGQKGYISNSQVTIFSVEKSGDVVLSKDVKINTVDGQKIIEKGTKLPVYDYTNKHYMVKWNGFYYFVHETTVEKKLTGTIEKPVTLDTDIFGESETVDLGLEDLFNDMDIALSGYQNKVKIGENVTSDLIGSGSPAKENIAEIPKETATTASTKKDSTLVKINIDKYSGVKIVANALEELGKAYVWGTVGPNSYDCSGFTYAMYQSIGVKIPRVSADQGQNGISVEKNNLQPGDLVFFDTRSVNDPEDITVNTNESSFIVEVVNSGDDRVASTSTVKKFKPTKITHVGMYIGDGYFIHASSGEKKVVIQSLELRYYQDRYLWSKRYL